MDKKLEWGVEKKEYAVPMVELYRLSVSDIVRTSPSDEGNDNDFGAGDLGDF